MDAQELQSPERVSAIWFENLNSTANEMNSSQSLKTDMISKDAINWIFPRVLSLKCIHRRTLYL